MNAASHLPKLQWRIWSVSQATTSSKTTKKGWQRMSWRKSFRLISSPLNKICNTKIVCQCINLVQHPLSLVNCLACCLLGGLTLSKLGAFGGYSLFSSVFYCLNRRSRMHLPQHRPKRLLELCFAGLKHSAKSVDLRLCWKIIWCTIVSGMDKIIQDIFAVLYKDDQGVSWHFFHVILPIHCIADRSPWATTLQDSCFSLLNHRSLPTCPLVFFEQSKSHGHEVWEVNQLNKHE